MVVYFFLLRYRSPDPSVEEEALKENEEALSRLSQNPTRKPNHVSVNAAAGLIIMNNRPAHNPLPKPPSQSHSTVESSPTNNSVSSAVSTSSFSQQQPIPSLLSVRFFNRFVSSCSFMTIELNALNENTYKDRETGESLRG